MLLACRVPLVMAVEQTGAARVIADAVVVHLPTTDPIVVVGATLGFAALLTPFVDNVSVAAVLSPVAAGVATRSGIPIERSEERRVGKECVSTCRYRWSPYHYKKNKYQTIYRKITT